MNDFSFKLARSIQKFVKRKKTVGYSHPPISDANGSWKFNVHGHGDGRLYLVTVKEIK